MGRRAEPSGKRDKLVALRLNPAEVEELEQKRARRGMDASRYFRTLMKEDTDERSS
ncbi:ribbon-helix-helix DNA binding domain protein [Microbacterium phage SadLad]|nr:ribbon-helix-helix DNA binding domain protein [Microbacterium phage SadLad]